MALGTERLRDEVAPKLAPFEDYLAMAKTFSPRARRFGVRWRSSCDIP